MHDLLKKIIDRKASARDLALLEELCDMVKSTSLCGLGQTAPNPVLSTLRYFHKEYDELLIADEGAGEPAGAKETVS
jgi:bidirectional [NiFe] hydrogenase diaphorase subunit